MTTVRERESSVSTDNETGEGGLCTDIHSDFI